MRTGRAVAGLMVLATPLAATASPARAAAGIKGRVVSANRPPLRVGQALAEFLDACRPTADVLGCRAELEGIPVLAGHPGNHRQRRIAARGAVAAVAAVLADEFTSAPRTLAAA